MTKTAWLVVLLTTGCTAGAVSAQEAAKVIEPRNIVDCPTAGLLPHGAFDLDLRIFPGGGVVAGLQAGLLYRLLLGVSFGGENIIGSGDIDWYPKLEFAAKYRVVEEGRASPALAVGFDSQGLGVYQHADSGRRYAVKSKGLYLVFSKSYTLLGPLGVHLGLNYSLERDDGDDDLSGYVGLDKALAAGLSLGVEYDLAINDNQDSALTSSKGYLNAGARWVLWHKLDIQFDVKNLSRRSTILSENPKPSREMRLVCPVRF